MRSRPLTLGPEEPDPIAPEELGDLLGEIVARVRALLRRDVEPGQSGGSDAPAALGRNRVEAQVVVCAAGRLGHPVLGFTGIDPQAPGPSFRTAVPSRPGTD